MRNIYRSDTVTKVTTMCVRSCLIMAAAESGDAESENKSVEIIDLDPRLDFYSEKFDPLFALNTPGVVVPVLTAKTYDNIHIYKSAQEKHKHVKVVAPKAENSNCERKFLPHQMPVKSTYVPNRRSIFTRMEKMEGPLSLLNKCKNEKLKIKVWTRDCSGIRGYCTAFITAFDKHWNMALSDITEVWTRRKKRKEIVGNNVVPNRNTSKRRVVPPKITVIKSDKKTETCTRYVDQYVLRGEHVVLVQILPSECCSTSETIN